MLVKLKQTTYTASRGKLEVSASGVSAAGVKPSNEDAIAINAPEKPSRSTKGIVAVIADGVSHAQYAANASQYCVQEFSKAYYNAPKTWSTQRILCQVLNQINSRLLNKKSSQDSSHEETSNPHKPQWLTTFSGIVFKSATAHCFHVGDTQISRFRNGKLARLTTPHNQTLTGNNRILTRAFGADSQLKVDYLSFEVEAGDIFVLTTDGVHEWIDNSELTELLSNQSDLNIAAQQAIDLACKKTSQDNLSCLLIKVASVPKLQPEEIRKTLLQKTIPPALRVGQNLDGYRVILLIHESARSHLYLSEEMSTGKHFTLKIPSINFSEDEIYLQGFIREAWVGSQVDHPTIMKIYPTKTDSQFLYHVCEYIQGNTLRQWMFDNPSPTLDQVRVILKQLIQALRLLKNLDIVHRDIKPENVMIDQHGQIKLIDYGTASIAAIEEQVNRLSETIPPGTVNYIAPESINNLQSSYKSDLFSLGVIAYEMFTGKLPYPSLKSHNFKSQQKDYSKWQYQSARDSRAEIPFWLDLALRKAVEANPLHRYSLYSEFENDISKPNPQAEQSFNARPLIEKDPVKFWKSINGGLLVIVLILVVRLIH